MFLSAQVSRLEADGSLIVDLREQDGPILRFGAFAQGMPWYRRSVEGWVETAFDWGARLANRAHHARDDLPVLRYLRGWPDDALEALFPVWYGQSSALQLYARHSATGDLLRTNPTLLWLLAARCVETAGWRERAAELLALPQRALLAQVLDVPDVRPAQVRFLRKLVVMAGTQTVLSQVRRIAADEAMVLALRHWPRLPTPLLPLVCGPLLRHLHWFKARLAETADRWMLGQILERYSLLIRDTDRMLGQLGIDALDRTLVRACRSPRHLSILHDALVAAINGVEDGNDVNAA